MKSTYVLFRSRSELYNFASILKSYGIMGVIVSTPHTLTVSCSLAVKISCCDVIVCRNILSRRNFATFTGIYEVDEYFARPAVVNKIM